MSFVPKFLKKINSNKKVKLLSQLFTKKESVLDFGCGDLQLGLALKKKRPSLRITGVDVFDLKNIPPSTSFVRYDGKKLPFKNDSFDSVIAFYVLHHCASPEASLRECVRVAKRVIIVESVARNNLELPFMSFMDWAYNVIKPEPVSLTYQFKTHSEWERIFKKLNVTITRKKIVSILPQPSFLPIGQTFIFELSKNPA